VVIEGLLEHLQQVGTAAPQLLGRRDRARDEALAADLRGAAAEQRHHVGRVHVEVQAGLGVVAAAATVGRLVRRAFVADVVHVLAGRVLGARHAGMQADAPVRQLGILFAPAVDRKPFSRHMPQRPCVVAKARCTARAPPG
jgi:hypothetical protein